MQTNIYQLYNRKLNGLTVFRALLEDVLIQRLQKLLRACEESDAETLTCTYGAFTSALFEKNVNFSRSSFWNWCLPMKIVFCFPQREKRSVRPLSAMPQSENWISLRSWQGFPQRQ